MSFASGFKVGYSTMDDAVEDYNRARANKEWEELDKSDLKDKIAESQAKAEIYERRGLYDLARQYKTDASTLASQALNRQLATNRDKRASDLHPGAVDLQGLRVEGAGLSNRAAEQNIDFNAQANPLRVEGMAIDNAQGRTDLAFDRQMNPMRLGEQSMANAARGIDLAQARDEEAKRLALKRIDAEITQAGSDVTGRERITQRATAMEQSGLFSPQEINEESVAAIQAYEADATNRIMAGFSQLPPDQQTVANLKGQLAKAIGPLKANQLIAQYNEADLKNILARGQRFQADLSEIERTGTLGDLVNWWDGVNSNTDAEVVQTKDGRYALVEKHPNGTTQMIAAAATPKELKQAALAEVYKEGVWSIAAMEAQASRQAAGLEAEKTQAEIDFKQAQALKEQAEAGWYASETGGLGPAPAAVSATPPPEAVKLYEKYKDDPRPEAQLRVKQFQEMYPDYR